MSKIKQMVEDFRGVFSQFHAVNCSDIMTLLDAINAEHEQVTGELRAENERLKKENGRLKDFADAMERQADAAIADRDEYASKLQEWEALSDD